jgi:glutathione-specific gamma-glutamylcyclotransferase
MSHWVFAYGSLMWRPDFTYVRYARARLDGYHRSLCHLSNHYRGTDEKPGLVFALDMGGYCEGIAFEVSNADWPEAYALLHEREMSNHTYHEMHLPVRVEDVHVEGELNVVTAMCYVMNHDHGNYAGQLSEDAIVKHVRQGVGKFGSAEDYVRATHAKLKELGIVDQSLDAIVLKLDHRQQAGQSE